MSNDNMALLAAASYADFKDIKNTQSIQKALSDEKIYTSQIQKFTDTYEILAHRANTANGYSGTIVKNKNSGEYFVLHRGTEITTLADWIEDGILVTGGLAHNWKKHAKINRL